METQKKNKVAKLHIKTGDLVKVIAGNSKGHEGKVISVDRKKLRAKVGGANIVIKHVKPTAANPQGERKEMEGTIHISNLMLINPANGLPRRIGRKRDEKGKLQRYFKEHTSLKQNTK
ncbi:MAG: 50S ribosomal protein L24 [Cytophagales bacterium]|nr:MAG: 50S ribosomal protein L24 [Cytophagales bacterium]